MAQKNINQNAKYSSCTLIFDTHFNKGFKRLNPSYVSIVCGSIVCGSIVCGSIVCGSIVCGSIHYSLPLNLAALFSKSFIIFLFMKFSGSRYIQSDFQPF